MQLMMRVRWGIFYCEGGSHCHCHCKEMEVDFRSNEARGHFFSSLLEARSNGNPRWTTCKPNLLFIESMHYALCHDLFMTIGSLFEQRIPFSTKCILE